MHFLVNFGGMFVIIALIVALMLLLNFALMWVLESRSIVTLEDAPKEPVAIVFGAGLLHTGEPTAVLRDRVQTAVALYQMGKVTKVLMTGDNSTEYYNEPAAMRQYAVELGLPDSAIVLDYAGRRTYDSCYRAKAIFGLSRVILVTQKFHLIRALFLCRNLGLRAVGVEANNITYRPASYLYWNIREIPARTVAMFDLLLKQEPILGDPEPIFPEENNAPQ